ncbi:MAG: sulfur carrier protein ThiS [Burkholderiaceae bacterium]|nr:sulfur carrier protein ThiS [Burkholderiaceae bacterium]
MTIEIMLNGEAKRLPQGHSVHDLVDSLGLTGKALAVAVNRQVVPRASWLQRALQPDDRVEIVRAIGGG